MSIYSPLFKTGKDQGDLERLTTGCGALPCLLTEDMLDETIVFYHQEKIFVMW